MSRLGQTIEAPRSSTLTSKTESADRERAALIPLTRDTGKATLVPPTRRTVRTSVFPSRDTAALLARKAFIGDTFSKVATAFRGVRRRYVVPGGYPKRTCGQRPFRAVDGHAGRLESPLQRARREHVPVMVIGVNAQGKPFDHDARHKVMVTERVGLCKVAAPKFRS